MRLGKFEGNDTLYIYKVGVDHNVSAAGSVDFRQQNCFTVACTRIGNDAYVAFSHPDMHQVTLHRLVWPPTPSQGTHDVFAGIYVNNPNRLLFRKDLLLVDDWNPHNNSDAILSIRESGGRLSEKRVLLAAAAKDPIDMRAWALAGDRLVLWDFISEDLLIYAFA